MIDLMQLIQAGRKVADDLQAKNYAGLIADSAALFQMLAADAGQLFPPRPAVDPNAPPPLAAHVQQFANLGADQLATKIDEVCDQHEAQATKLGAGQQAAAGNHPVIQGFIKNILPLLIQALKFLPAA